MSSTEPELSGRETALLRAVAAGRCELVCGCEPDLLIDGRWCGDQSAAHNLATAGLIGPAEPVGPGERITAIVTDAGRALLETTVAA